MQRSVAVSIAGIVLTLACGSSVAVAQPQALDLEKVRALLQLKTPDSALASEISRRGLSFVPTKQTLSDLRHLGAGPATLEAIDELRPLLEDAREAMPSILKDVFAALDEGNPQKVRTLLSNEVASSALKLDAMCRPFTYRAHLIEEVVERPGRRIEVRVRALFQPLEERAIAITLESSGGRFVIVDVRGHSPDWLGGWETAAEEVARKFAYAATAGRAEVVRQLASPGLPVDAIVSPECVTALQGQRELGRASVTIRDDKGLKAVVDLHGSWGAGAIVVDRIDGQDRVVRFAAPCEVTETSVAIGSARAKQRKTRVRGEDPSLEAYTLTRFGLKHTGSPATSAESGATGAPSVEPANQLARAEAALAAGNSEEAGQMWDEVLAGGGTLNLRACRERFLRCEIGKLSVSADRVSFADAKGTVVFGGAPAEIEADGVEKYSFLPNQCAFRLRAGGKKYSLFYLPPFPECSTDPKVTGSKVVYCSAVGLRKQTYVAEYLSRALPRLARVKRPAAAVVPPGSAGVTTPVAAESPSGTVASAPCGDDASCLALADELLESDRYSEMRDALERARLGGASLSWKMCREGGWRCTPGVLTVGATEVRLVDDKGVTVFSGSPRQVTGLGAEVSRIALTSESVGRLKMRVSGKDYGLDYMPLGVADCKRTRFYHCAAPAAERQLAVAEYIMELMRKLGGQ